MAEKKTTGGTGTRKRTTKKEAAKIGEKPVKTGSRVKDEIWAIIIIVLGAFLVIALQTQAAGRVGELISALLKGLFGGVAYVLPYYLILYGILTFAQRTAHIGRRTNVFAVLIFLMIVLVNAGFHVDSENIVTGWGAVKSAYSAGTESGGAIGMLFAPLIVKAVGKTGLFLFAAAGIVISLLLVINTPISQFFDDAKVRKAEKQRIRIEEAEAYEAERKARDAEISARTKEEHKAALERQKMKEDKVAAKAATNEKLPASVDDTGYVPGRMNHGQAKIMTYMQDESLFEGASATAGTGLTGLGLEDGRVSQPGFGLDGGAVSSGGLGLEPVENVAEAEKSETAAPAEEKRGFFGRLKKISQVENEEKAAEAEKTADAGEKAAGATLAENGEKAGETVSPLNKEKEQTKEEAEAELQEELAELAEEEAQKKPPYELPSIDLLELRRGGKSAVDKAGLEAKAQKLEDTLASFHVGAKVVQVTKGPSVTRFEIQPDPGVKVSKISSLQNDIAMNMEAKSMRIEAPIPGKAAVGIEIENDKIDMVSIREVIDSSEFRNHKSKTAIALGRDIGGNPVVGDIKSMPHVLIAGSTGSGKSVCINSIIVSLLYKAKPDEVKLVLIDPKKVELGNYNGIGHLLIPVVTEPAKAAAALNWACAEMDERYRKFVEAGVRDLNGYNEKLKAEGEEPIPQIVIIIDELADLMMAAPSQVEESICRIAQLARAAGMHLVVATQRPSVDVITGVIKANIPSRIAFAVASQFDSRTILDMSGAEKLVGKGDMLYCPQGMSKPTRVQGNFISDDEIERVIAFVKSQGAGEESAKESGEIMSRIEKVGAADNAGDEDELLPDAIAFVVAQQSVSTSSLQRRFRIGYNRAARIVDMLEERGIIGPADGSRPRQVLLTQEAYEAEIAEISAE